ncbi:rab11 family-interacting protein 3 isoform X1 [Mastomys coucha]|uniref:rab11 family-interacting protein 3 isoform X1 n=1 Tax=Mastomys coucha TaxID=35658 RepID=UPI0012614CDC|nr:rab11 family-interacting protein 3 isoform X1 [Mastomys coucha]
MELCQPASLSDHDEPASGPQRGVKGPVGPDAPRGWSDEPEEHAQHQRWPEGPNAPICWPEEVEEPQVPSRWAREPDGPRCSSQEPDESCHLAKELEEPDAPRCSSQEPDAPCHLAKELEEPDAPRCWPQESDAPCHLAKELEEPDAPRCWPQEPDESCHLAEELEEPDTPRCWPQEPEAFCHLLQEVEEPDAPLCWLQEPDAPCHLGKELEDLDVPRCCPQEPDESCHLSKELEEPDAACLLAKEWEESDAPSCWPQEPDVPSHLAKEWEESDVPSLLAEELEESDALHCWPQKSNAPCLLSKELEEPGAPHSSPQEVDTGCLSAKEPEEPDTSHLWPGEPDALCLLVKQPEGADAPHCWPEEPEEPNALNAPCFWANEPDEPDAPRCWSEEPQVLCLWPEKQNTTRCWQEESDAPCFWLEDREEPKISCLQFKEPEKPKVPCSWPEELEDCCPTRGLPLEPLLADDDELLQACPGPPLDPGPALSLPSEPGTAQEEGARLRTVFDALDRDGDGFVRIEDFIQFATVYGAEQVKDLTQYLDPSGLGVISFEDFHQGIVAIRNGDPDGQLYSVEPVQDEEPPACADEFDDFVTYEANEVTDSAYMGSESTYSECETFTDEDTSTLVHPELQPEGDADSAGGSGVPSECLDTMEEPDHGALLLLPGRSRPHSQGVVMVIGSEEHFEDYGEGSEAELSPETLCNGELDCEDPAFLTPSSNPLASKLCNVLTDEAFEFYCSQCHKQINRLEDLSARLTDLEMNSPAKQLSSRKVARYLHQSGTLTMEALEDPPPEPVECPEEDIADKVIFLERRVSELEKDSAAAGEQHGRLRQENLQLVHRANALEEQLKEQEFRAQEKVLEETRKQKELLCKMEREKSIEIENLQARLQQLDEENSELRSCTPCLKANIERLEEEKQKMLDEIEELTQRLSEEQENKRKMGDKLSHERHQFQRDKEATQELIEDLRKQLEHLQLLRLEVEQRRGRSSSLGLQEYNSRARESELEQEIRRLKQDNRNLKEQNDELNGQIITLSIQGAKSLFSTSFSESLAAEISSVSRDELMEAIQKQEEINFRLQDYIDRIIVAILETNPSILEVK